MLKIAKTIKFLIFCASFALLWSCSNVKQSSTVNVNNTQMSIKDLERRDHQICMSQGVDLEKWTDVSAEMYWRCRYNLMQDKIVHNPINPNDAESNAIIQEVSDKILKNLQKAHKAVLVGIDENPEESDHAKCLKLGYTLDPKNQDKNEAYYECRKQMIDNRTSAVPGIVTDKQPIMTPANQSQQHVAKIAQYDTPPSGEVEFTINRMKQYPNCMNVNVKSKLFDKCVGAQKQSLLCLDNMRTVNAKKQLDDKIYCQKQSILQFPDNYTLTRDKSAKEIEEMLKKEREDEIADEKAKQEMELNRTQKFFGESYASKDKLFSDESDTKNIKDKQNEREAMYNKIQILELREEFVVKCNQLLDQKLPDTIEMERRKCLNIGKNWYDIDE